MLNWIKNKKSELLVYISGMTAMWFAQFQIQDLTKWAWGICILGSCYMLSRSFFKKGSGNKAVMNGFFSTEFLVLASACAQYYVPFKTGRLNLEVIVLCVSILCGVYMLSRGNAKGENQWTTPNL